MYTCVFHIWICAKEDRSIISPGAGVAGGCELLGMPGGNQMWDFARAVAPTPRPCFLNIFLHGHVIKLPSKYLCLSQYICVSHKLSLRNFCF